MRSLALGNGSLLVTLDGAGEVRDLYFPHVGLENHAGGELRHRLGIYVDGRISWLAGDPGWRIRVECAEDSLESRISAVHDALGISLSFKDLVYNESDIFLREVVVKELGGRARSAKLFFGQEFEISRAQGGDTAYYDPATGSIIHYKGPRAFLINGRHGEAPFDDYAIGLFGVEGKDGAWRDAEDGALSKNAIEHGSVDSIIGFSLSLSAHGEETVRYWLAAGDSVDRAIELNAYVLKKTPQHLITTAGDYWRAWVNRYEWSFYQMSPATVALFKRSLMFVRAHADDGGGIIASADAETLQYKEDTYAYVWPRDASYAARALERAGDSNVAERFFTFCAEVISDEGYFMHKFLPDRSLGSSWHPWVRDNEVQLPIQEDETALVVWNIAEHYRHSRDLEFIEKLYNPLIEKAADFMMTYRDAATGLPHASYDLWEEKHGISTFTSASVCGALKAAASLARVLGKNDRADEYERVALEIRDAILTHLVSDEAGGFVKLIETFEKKTVYDRTPDISSVYGIFTFGVLEPEDPRLEKAFGETVTRLSVDGGIGRYVADKYFRTSDKSNPWFITTLWYGQYLIARAKTAEDLAPVRDIFEWVAAHAQSSGVLSEQISAADGRQRSVAPLAWSHAAYVDTVLDYLDKLEALGVCAACNPAP